MTPEKHADRLTKILDAMALTIEDEKALVCKLNVSADRKDKIKEALVDAHRYVGGASALVRWCAREAQDLRQEGGVGSLLNSCFDRSATLSDDSGKAAK